MDPVLADAVYERLMENITKSESDPQVVRSWHRMMVFYSLTLFTCIPQRPYCQESAIPGGGAGMIMFAMLNGESFPAALALAGHCDHLADGGEVFFIEKNQTIDLQIEVFDPFVVPKLSADPNSASIVAGVRWMGRKGEHCLSQMN